MALLIGITAPMFLPGEAQLIEAALRGGVDVVHLRKPEATVSDVEHLIAAISPTLRLQLVLHDHYPMAARYGLRGVHLNSRHTVAEAQGCRIVSRSCHTIAEVEQHKAAHDYVFMSPICDSISKQGYRAAFAPEQLTQAAREGIIDRRVVALGGITADNAAQVMQYGFGGVAVLGYLWSDTADEVERRALKLKQNITQL